MDLSIICPTLNEIDYIDQVINDLCADDGLDKEVLIVDGGSTDGTRERVAELASTYPNLRLVDNPGRTSTAAFNIGINQNTSDFVAFVGAHARYSSNYFTYGIQRLRTGDCDIIGGLLKQEGKSETGKAIALAMSSRLGVGNTAFRVSQKEQQVESVAFAIYSRKAIEKAGPMDESLPVNQDDEYHYRLHSLGLKLLMTNKTQAVYYVRGSYRSLFRQYFRYGKYKPAVLKKVNGSWRLRHIIPSLFVAYLASLPLGLLVRPWLAPFCVYAIAITIGSFSVSKGDLKMAFRCIPAFLTLHSAYGIGFISGILNLKPKG